ADRRQRPPGRTAVRYGPRVWQAFLWQASVRTPSGLAFAPGATRIRLVASLRGNTTFFIAPMSSSPHSHLPQISRRGFVRRCAIIAAATGLPTWFVERQLVAAERPLRRLGPNDRPGIALIGCGGMG